VIGAASRRLVARLVRVTAYVLVLTLGLGVLAARTVHASAKDGAFALGERLLDLSANGDDAAHELSINGQLVHVTSAQTSRPLAEVLDRFQGSCEDHADGMVDDLRDLGAALDRPASQEGFPGLGVLRDVRDGRGVVACFAANRATDHLELAARLERFATSTDLADVGHLRYVAARTLESGATQVVATWTSGPVRLGEMFPEHGDAAGDDPAAAPRPAGTRVLSARDRLAPYGVFLYTSHAKPEAALAAYGTSMSTAGFHELPAVAERAPEARAYERPGLDVLVTAEPLEDGTTILSIIEMPANGAARRTK
jgi:hypothetical protein